MRQLESAIENKVVKDSKKLGIKYALKMTIKGSVGWPDRLMLIPGGRPFFLELKRPGEKPRDIQRYRIRELERLGYDVAWADDAEHAIRLVADRVEAARRAASGGEVPVKSSTRHSAGLTGLWEDKLGFGDIQSADEKRFGDEDVGGGAAASGNVGLAARDSKVDRVQSFPRRRAPRQRQTKDS